eukprot:TRINITY_DN7015_c0_g1_i3.p1 TRINITY_DN7015_c0_g1~~TRINITY_DN7015_c0_g1_i3.p1  ORF type:complete len:322 (-),score=105.38 TRINITY_DN7015_c0_g1_i3:55-1020(-)
MRTLIWLSAALLLLSTTVFTQNNNKNLPDDIPEEVKESLMGFSDLEYLSDIYNPFYEPWDTIRLRHLNDLADLCSKHVKVAESPGRDLGLFAKKDIAKGTPILRIPKNLITSSFDDYPRSYFFWELIDGSPTEVLIGHLLYQKYVNRNGYVFDYYVNWHNPDYYQATHLFWTDEEELEYKTRRGLWSETTKRDIMTRLKYIIEMNEPYKDLYEPKFPAEMITEDAFKWAYAVIQSRSIPLTRFEWYALHGYNKNTYKRNAPVQYKEVDYTQDSPGIALVPILDLINHEDERIEGKYNVNKVTEGWSKDCLLYTSPSPRDQA